MIKLGMVKYFSQGYKLKGGNIYVYVIMVNEYF